MAFNLGDIFITLKAKTDDLNRGMAEVQAFAGKIEVGASKMQSALATVTSVAQKAAAGAAIVGTALGVAGGFAVKSAADLQQTSDSFKVLIGNTATANKLFGTLANYANNTPFEFKDISAAGKTLLGFGISASEVMGKMKQLGDVAAVTGAPMQNLAVVFGQVTGAGRLQAENFLQLVDMGVPIGQMLKSVGVDTSKLDKIWQSGGISLDVFNKAFEKAGQSGQFAFQGTDKLAQTFNGRMSTLKDTIAEFGRNLLGVKIDPELGLTVESGGLFDLMSKGVEGLTNKLKDLGPAIAGSFKWLVDNQEVVVGAITAIGVAFMVANPEILAVVAAFTLVAGIGAALGAAFKLLKADGIDPVKGAVDVLRAAWDFLKPSLEQLWNVISTQLLPSLKNLWDAIAPVLVPALQVLATIAGGVLVLALRNAINTLAAIITVISTAINVLSVLYGWFSGIVGPIASAFAKILPTIMGALGGVFGAITKPFADAFNWLFGKVDAVVKKLRDLDPFVRHSPSLFDRVKLGTEAIRKEYGGMFDSLRDMAANGAVATFAPALMPTNGSAAAINSASTMMNSVTNGGGVTVNNYIDGPITSPHVADDYAEKIGDGIIRQLQKSWRI